MLIKANRVVWRALLDGCRVHKNVELAEEAIKHLHVLDPLNDGYYVVLSNVYENVGRWEDATKVRMMMREIGVKKILGWSTDGTRIISWGGGKYITGVRGIGPEIFLRVY
ncbi:hypothetical protein GIB67_017021 [Kingdonia uniflora]|uniref:Pentatricopeptide repeat-containing protein n=1 Tax=Kingdonia uniflora TaxID=39325 RepID=A0A7J7LRY5_9MAGN|nr:hypothetical protein GIB67_017021 [Kingdonia uniflora]